MTDVPDYLRDLPAALKAELTRAQPLPLTHALLFMALQIQRLALAVEDAADREDNALAEQLAAILRKLEYLCIAKGS